MWGLADGPVPNVIRVIEDAGGIVVRYPFGTPKIDAISRWVPGLPPLFFVNTNLPPDRERLTLAHELGHVFMHDVPNPDMESQANAFAAEFLMPAKDIAHHLDRVTLERLAVLKPYWRVAMSALLYRATELRKLSRRSSQFLWMEMSKHGYRRVEPIHIEGETPTALRELIDLHRQHFGYGLDEFASMLAAEPQELVSLYGITQTAAEVRPTLRVVHNRADRNGSQ
jgi:Zn-dependent peptidase ImmA (M78 family)